ncbi:FAD-dependent oxidoreductase [Psychroflexus sp. YR1-1]|uniref:FAD-dependent oxidoreductase n=1 Tax=Psychroflexus aurantiacus TaxID=2709310 RepID=A0A6B3R2T0_9FLAO|nr:FAD-dependent oxidoreductase [Psychroflexus aurantiacus]NEV94833.1 FAD-dependent oxidoreductase [Psychroflexus aurantiacus]
MKDVLIVGFGIAGLSVAKQLELRSRTFDIIADESQDASKVAGGVLNPVALKRYNLAWNAEEFMPQAIDFYSQFNSESGEAFFKSVPVYKLFSSAEDQNNWTVASDQRLLEPFLNPKIQKVTASVQSDFKAGEVLQSHLLSLKSLIEHEKERYIHTSQFISEPLKHAELHISRDEVIYKQGTYKAVVFCEGYGITDNPFFNWLPVYGNKGEYLIFKSVDLKANESIFKAKNFLIPLGNDLYKYGATYSRENLNDLPTEGARVELKDKLSGMINCDFEIVDQVAGVRPTVRDRKPVLGRHPRYKNLYILNGFGSRGVMAAPGLSEQLVDCILQGKDIDQAINLSRFLKFYV